MSALVFARCSPRATHLQWDMVLVREKGLVKGTLKNVFGLARRQRTCDTVDGSKPEDKARLREMGRSVATRPGPEAATTLPY